MAKQTIGIGTIPNDGTGDTLRDAMEITNNNFTELYNTHGWGFYQDDLSGAVVVIGITPVKLTINGLHANSTSAYLPREIRGISELWDTTTNFMTPINLGDSYNVRIDFSVTLESGNPSDLILSFDIGGGATPTIVVLERHISAGKSVPYSISIGTPTFALATFLANGAQLFLHTDSGTVTIGDRSIFISRTSNGLL